LNQRDRSIQKNRNQANPIQSTTPKKSSHIFSIEQQKY
jgi:hypothetical protein